MACCSVMLRERRAPRSESALSRSLPRDTWRLRISRSPIRRDANCDVPPFSLPEQRKIRVFPQYAAAAEFSQPRQRVLETVDGAERVELVNDEPQTLIPVLRLTHGLEYGEAHPSRNHGAQCGDLPGLVRDE